MLVLPLELIRVRGRSMLPTYAEGDLLVVVRGGRLQPGKVVVLDLPPDRYGQPRPRSLKRLLRREPTMPGHWWIDSDNAREGVTSFDVGAIPESDIHAVVLFRLRRGRGGPATASTASSG